MKRKKLNYDEQHIPKYVIAESGLYDICGYLKGRSKKVKNSLDRKFGKSPAVPRMTSNWNKTASDCV